MQSTVNKVFPRCLVCDMTFVTISQWRKHRKYSHNIEAEIKYKIPCQKCHLLFADRQSLNAHETAKHYSKWRKTSSITSPQRLRLECETDGALFRKRKLLSQQERENKKPRQKNDYRCEQCNESFFYERRYIEHSLETHGLYLFHCKTCFSICESKAKLDEHLKENLCKGSLSRSEFLELDGNTSTHRCVKSTNNGITTQVTDIDAESPGSRNRDNPVDNSNTDPGCSNTDKGVRVIDNKSPDDVQLNSDKSSRIGTLLQREKNDSQSLTIGGQTTADNSHSALNSALDNSRTNLYPKDNDIIFHTDSSIAGLSHGHAQRIPIGFIDRRGSTQSSNLQNSHAKSYPKNNDTISAMNSSNADTSRVQSQPTPIEVIDIGSPFMESSNLENSNAKSHPTNNDTIFRADNSNADTSNVQSQPIPIEVIDIGSPFMQSSNLENSNSKSRSTKNDTIFRTDNSNADISYVQSQPIPIEVIAIDSPSTGNNNLENLNKDNDTISHMDGSNADIIYIESQPKRIEVIEIDPPSVESLYLENSHAKSDNNTILDMDILNADNNTILDMDILNADISRGHSQPIPIGVIDIEPPFTESCSLENSRNASYPKANDMISNMDSSNAGIGRVHSQPIPIGVIDIDPPSTQSSNFEDRHATTSPKDNDTISPKDSFDHSQPIPIGVIDIDPPSTQSSNFEDCHATTSPKDNDTFSPKDSFDHSQPKVIEVNDIYFPMENLNADNYSYESQFAAILSPSNPDNSNINADNSRTKSHRLEDKVIPSNNTDNSSETPPTVNNCEIMVVDPRSLTTDNSFATETKVLLETEVVSPMVEEPTTNDDVNVETSFSQDSMVLDNLNQELSTQDGTTLIKERDVADPQETYEEFDETNATTPMTSQPIDNVNYESQNCPICQKTVRNFDFLAKHVADNHYVLPYHCSVSCQFSCLKLEELIEHVLDGHSVENRMNISINPQCLDCDKRFWSLKNWKRHMTTHHDGILKTTSGKRDERGNFFVTTDEGRSGENDVTCQICGDKFPHALLLSIHERHLHRTRPWNCDECQVSTDLKNELFKHKMRTHKLTPISETKPSCRICERSFGSLNLWQEHRRDIFSKGDGCENQGDGFINRTSTDIQKLPMHCVSKNCDKIFHNMSDYVKHRETEHETIQCPLVCDFRTIYKEEFYKHLRNKHLYKPLKKPTVNKEPKKTVKPLLLLRCNAPNCQQVFKSMSDYQSHIDSQHPNRYECHLRCNFKTEIRRELTRHLRDVHGENIAISTEDKEAEIMMPVITNVISLREFMPSHDESTLSDAAMSFVQEGPSNNDSSQSAKLRENTTASLYDNVTLNGVPLTSQWRPEQFKTLFQPFVSLKHYTNYQFFNVNNFNQFHFL